MNIENFIKYQVGISSSLKYSTIGTDIDLIPLQEVSVSKIDAKYLKYQHLAWSTLISNSLNIIHRTATNPIINVDV